MWWTKRSWSSEAEEARAKVESQEGSESLSSAEKAKLTRRQALAKFGFQAGAAAVAALTADDLLRKVGEEMQKRAGDSEVANAVAKEFKNAGVAFAVTAEPESVINVCDPFGVWPGCSKNCVDKSLEKCVSCHLLISECKGPSDRATDCNNGSNNKLQCLACAKTAYDNCIAKGDYPKSVCDAWYKTITEQCKFLGF